MGLKQNIINAFLSEPIKWVNFTFANRMISPICFYYTANLVQNDRIKVKTDPSLTDRAEYDPVDDTISARDHSYGELYWDEKSTLIHEGAHAFLDVCNGHDMNNKPAPAMLVVDDETIGYLAGAIYLVAAQGASFDSSQAGQPSYEAMKVVKPKVEALKAKSWTGTESMTFTVQEVKDLQAAIRKHPFYSSSWHTKSTQNGLKRP